MKSRKTIFLAILAACIYGLNAPLSKLLLAEIDPLVLAGLLYAGAGLGMAILFPWRKRITPEPSQKITRRLFPYLLGMILLDIVAPLLFMLGLQSSSGATASLIGTFEIVATAGFAFLIFKEHIARHVWIGMVVITGATILLVWSDAGMLTFSPSTLLIIAATLCWGLENNLTRHLSAADPLVVVVYKGIFAGLGALGVAWLSGADWPTFLWLCAGLGVGFITYGLSLLCYIRAQRDLGAALTSAYYGLAPFIGVFFSCLLFWSLPPWTFFGSLLLMVVGYTLLQRPTSKPQR